MVKILTMRKSWIFLIRMISLLKVHKGENFFGSDFEFFAFFS
jgi:hypothetical protein